MKRTLSLILTLCILIGTCAALPAQAASDETNAYYQERIDYYEQFEDCDQQAISDEEFFGQWDDATDTWIIESQFDFENNPGLSALENAVKSGDYAAAEEELLEYYRAKIASNPYERTSRYTTPDKIAMAEMTMEGFCFRANGVFPLAKHTLTETPQWTTTDFLDRLNSVISGGQSAVNLRIYDARKDGYMTRIWSKDNAENQPYARVVVNGETRTYYPVADNTIRAGEFHNVNYGSEPYMYANESYTSINEKYSIDNPDRILTVPEDLLGATGSSESAISRQYTDELEFKPIDDYTMRGCLLFDFSDILPEDTVTVAELYLYGDMQRDQNPGNDPDLEEKESTMFFVTNEQNTLSWTDETHSWGKETQDSCFCYDREYGPNFATPTSVSGRWATVGTNIRFQIEYMCGVYRGMRDEAFAYHAIRLIKNTAYKLGNRLWLIDNGIMERAVAGQELIRELHTLVKSEWMTPDDFTTILKLLYLNTEFLVTGWNSTCEANNIGGIASGNLVNSAVFLTEFKKCYLPVGEVINENYPASWSGGWLPVGLKRVVYKLDSQVLEDGSSVEAPVGYIGTGLGPLVGLIDWAESMNFPTEVISENFSDEDKEIMIKAAYNYVNLSNPIAGTWQVGDDSTYNTTCISVAKQLVQLSGTDDPVLHWFITRGKEGHPPEDHTSWASDIAIKTVLRSDWSENAVAAYMDADGGGSWSHAYEGDDLAIKLMAYGKFILSDPLSPGYTALPIYANWTRSTRAHNTIEINSASQRFKLYYGGEQEEPFGEPLFNSMFAGHNGSLNDLTLPEHNRDGQAIEGTGGEELTKKRYFGTLYDYIRAETTGYLQNEAAGGNYVTERYMLFVKPGFYIVTDRINPTDDEKVNTYKQSWHLHHDMPFELDETTKNITSKSSGTANIVIAPVDTYGDVEPIIRQGVYSISGANSNNLVFRDYITYNRAKAGDIVYNTILYPLKSGEMKEITTSGIIIDGISEGEATAFTARVEDGTNSGGNELFFYSVLDETKKADRKVGYYKTDALLAYADKNANNQYDEFIIKNGTHLSIDGGRVLVENGSTEIADMAIKFEGNTLKIDTRDASQLDTEGAFRIYCEKPLTRVYVNDSSVYFEKVDNYIYLKETGLEQDPVENNNNNKKPSTPSHATGGDGGNDTDKEDENKEEQKPEDTKPEDTKPEDTKPEEIKVPEEFKTELDNHWAKEEMSYMVSKGLVQGSNGSLNLSGEVTRAEFIAVIVRALDLKTEEFEGTFKDVSENDWYAKYIESAHKYGLLSGYDGMATPNAVITREQMAKILVNAYAFVNGPVTMSSNKEYKDSHSISDWAKEYIDKCTHLALMNGYEDGSFKPLANTKRAEAFVTIYRLINK